MDYYQLLGVAKTATADEIKKAFRAKAHQYHPDKSTGDAEQFKKINEAYQVLSDPEKRSQYDQYGQTFDQSRRQGGAGGPSGFSGFENMDFGDLGDIFGDMFGFGGGRGQSRASRGRDIAARLKISFHQAAFGGEAEVQLRRPTVCGTCQGRGAESAGDVVTCATCQGSGRVRRIQQTMLGAMQAVTVCDTCHGEGTTIKKPCPTCRGEGRVDGNETLTVKIPAGIDTGQRVKLSGKGEAGHRGTPAGDLYLEVAVEPDKRFQRSGDDVMSQVEIPMTMAALGGTVEVETLDGTVTLKIPAGTEPGKVMALKGKGITKLRGRGRGDQHVTINIVIPRKLSSKAKKLLQELQAEDI